MSEEFAPSPYQPPRRTTTTCYFLHPLLLFNVCITFYATTHTHTNIRILWQHVCLNAAQIIVYLFTVTVMCTSFECMCVCICICIWLSCACVWLSKAFRFRILA